MLHFGYGVEVTVVTETADGGRETIEGRVMQVNEMGVSLFVRDRHVAGWEELHFVPMGRVVRMTRKVPEGVTT